MAEPEKTGIDENTCGKPKTNMEKKGDVAKFLHWPFLFESSSRRQIWHKQNNLNPLSCWMFLSPECLQSKTRWWAAAALLRPALIKTLLWSRGVWLEWCQWWQPLHTWSGRLIKPLLFTCSVLVALLLLWLYLSCCSAGFICRFARLLLLHVLTATPLLAGYKFWNPTNSPATSSRLCFYDPLWGSAIHPCSVSQAHHF